MRETDINFNKLHYVGAVSSKHNKNILHHSSPKPMITGRVIPSETEKHPVTVINQFRGIEIIIILVSYSLSVQPVGYIFVIFLITTVVKYVHANILGIPTG